MQRKYLAKHRVAVIDRNGRVLRVIKRKPYSSNGFDSYMYQGGIMPGYWNGAICNEQDCQAFIKVSEEKA